MYDKWYKEYIEGIDINNIKYINILSSELKDFYFNNGYDISSGNIIISDDASFSWTTPRGMHYLQFDNMPGMKYILGIVNNNINKKTIISALVYCDDYKIFSNQVDFITYLSTVETNMYFRNKGLYHDLIVNSFKFINQSQNILISEISNMGKKCHVYDSFIQIYKSMGFRMDISNENDFFNYEDYFEYLKKKNYIRIKR